MAGDYRTFVMKASFWIGWGAISGCVHIHFFGNGYLWFRSYSGSLLEKSPKSNQMYGQPTFCYPVTMNGKSGLR